MVWIAVFKSRFTERTRVRECSPHEDYAEVFPRGLFYGTHLRGGIESR